MQKAAALALGRMGKVSARPVLLRLLREEPTAEVLDAIAAVADEDSIVLMGRVMRGTPDLAEAARQALDEADHPRAAQVLRVAQTGSGVG